METTPRPESTVCFGPFELNLRTRELFKHGARLKIRGHPIDVLAILVQHPGDLVTRETLEKQLWPDGTFVDFEHILNNSIAGLRAALGDRPDSPKFIETLPRLGYRFIAPISRSPIEMSRSDRTPLAASAASAQTIQPRQARSKGKNLARRIPLAAGAVVVMVLSIIAIWHPRRPPPLPRIQSVAVLPFENLSGDPSQEYLADGMTEELITELGAFGGFRVVSRTSVMRLKRTSMPLPKIAHELGVDAIVEGSVARSGNHVRITANLLHAATDRHLWANSYESEVEDLLAVQSKVAHSVTDAIRTELTRHAQSAGTAPRRVNPEAYRAYLEGRYHVNRWTRDGFKKAEVCLRRSVDLDPTFAPAYSALAHLYTMLAIYGIRPAIKVFPLAKAAALKAVDLDDGLAEAHGALGLVKLVYDWDWAGAQLEQQRAVLLNPSSVEAHTWYGMCLTAMGRHEDALQEGREVVRLDPASPFSNLFLAWELYWARQHDEAISQVTRALELDPQFAWGYMELGWNYAEKRMYPEAIANCRRALEIMPDEQVILGTCGHVYALAGKRQDTLALLARLQSMAEKDYVDPWYIVGPYDGMGDVDHAIEYLQGAYNERSSGLYLLNVSLFSGRLRSDPRFQALLLTLNFPSRTIAAGPSPNTSAKKD